MVAGDVFVPDFIFSAAAAQSFAQSNDCLHLAGEQSAHVPNGDFALSNGDRVIQKDKAPDAPTYTYSNHWPVSRQHGPEMSGG